MNVNNIKYQNTTEHDKLFKTFLVVIFILPWPYGGEINWQYLVFALISFLMLSYLCITNHKQLNISSLNTIKLPIILLIIWVTFALIQVTPLPHAFVKLINPTSLDITENIHLINQNMANTATLSIAPNITLLEFIKYCSYLAFFLLGLILLDSKKRIIQLTVTIFLASATISIYSIIDYFSLGSINIIDPLPPWSYYSHDIIHGTFSYKNHYAAFLLLTIPLGFGLAYISPKALIYNKKIKGFDYLMSKKGGLFTLSTLMTTVLIMNSSRAGNGALLISFLSTLTLISFINRNNKIIKNFICTVSTAAIFLTIVFLSGIADKLISRYTSDGDNGRLQQINTAVNILKDYPITGSGSGTFPVVYQQYNSVTLDGSIMWRHVHNDYLELLSNQGMIGFSVLAVAILCLYISLLKGLKKSRHNKKNTLHSLSIASFCSVTAILLHSLADFNFQLPTNVVYFYLIIAIGIRAQKSSKHSC